MKKALLKLLSGFLLASSVLIPASPALATHTTGGDLLPDLVMLPPRELSIENADGEKRLRFRHDMANKHTGPVELFPQTFSGSDNDDCNGDGSSSNDRLVFQRIFRDANNDGIFTRGTDTGSRQQPAGCMSFHPSHSHWHFNDFALYDLRSMSGGAAASSVKTTSCMEDTVRSSPALPGSPTQPYYKGCNQVDPQGISVGWVDVYHADLPEQYIVINGLPDGAYCLTATADPATHIQETIESNNKVSIRVNLSGNTVTASSEACAPPPSSSTHFIYDEALRWSDWSWQTRVDPNVSSPVYSGSRSMGITYTAGWAGLSLHNSGFNTSPYSYLSFLIRPGGQPLSALRVLLYNSADAPLNAVNPQNYASFAGSGWYRVQVPLSALGAQNTTITRVTLQDDTGSAQPTFYLDDLGFISGSTPPPPPPTPSPTPSPAPSPTPSPSGSHFIYDDTLRWANWSWGTTLTPNASSPTFAGSSSMAATYTRAWAGLSLQHSGFDTSPYSHLSFYILPGGQSLSDISVWLNSASGAQLTAINPETYASSAGGGWYRVQIPLTALGAAGRTVTRVTLQENKGSAQPTFHLDNLGFVTGTAPLPTPTPSPSPTPSPTPSPSPSPSPVPSPTPSPSVSYFVYDDTLRWSNWSWRTTLNPSATSPVFEGTRSLGVTYTSAWAGLSLHHSGFDTTPYTHLSFYINPGSRLSGISVSLYDSTGNSIQDVDPQQYATAVGDGWYRVLIPFSTLGAVNTTISRVQIQDVTGAAQPTFYLDNLGFVKS